MEVQQDEGIFSSYTVTKRQGKDLSSGSLTPETMFLSMLMDGFSGCWINVWFMEVGVGWGVWEDAPDTSSPCVPLKRGRMVRLV